MGKSALINTWAQIICFYFLPRGFQVPKNNRLLHPDSLASLLNSKAIFVSLSSWGFMFSLSFHWFYYCPRVVSISQ